MDTTPKDINERLRIQERLNAKIDAMEQFLVEADEEIEELKERIEAIGVEKIRVGDVLAVLIEVRGDEEGVSPIEEPPGEDKPKVSRSTKKKPAKQGRKSKADTALKNARKAREVGGRAQQTLLDGAEDVLRSKSGQKMTLSGIAMELCGDAGNKGVTDQLSAALKKAYDTDAIDGLEREKDGQRVFYRIAS